MQFLSSVLPLFQVLAWVQVGQTDLQLMPTLLCEGLGTAASTSRARGGGCAVGIGVVTAV